MNNQTKQEDFDLEALGSGDRTEFARLVEAYSGVIYRLAIKMLENTQDAEDVLQETSMILWKKFDDFELGTNFAAWAIKVARYEAMKARRRKCREANLFSETFLEGLSREVERSMNLLESRREALAQCLDKLPEGDRQLLKERYERNMSARELASQNGRSERGIRNSLLRIRTRLLKDIERTLHAER